jgi:aspartate-semialdehyde dehydrogenase
VAAVEPVSSLGVAAVESLARQARQRIQGAPVEELINESVLAFNLVASEDEDLVQDAATLFPDLDLAVTRSLAGHFHGHVAHVCLLFYEPVEEYELYDALSSDTRIVAQEPPFALDATPETDQVTVLRPRLSRDRRCLATTALFDGLRIGGALTALEILQSILEPPS